MQSKEKPRILIDLYKTRNLNSGIGRFAFNFAESLAERNGLRVDFDFLSPRNFPERSWGQIGLKKVNFQKRYLPLFNSPYDIWHSLYQFPSHLPGRRSSWILTIHDLNFLVEKDKRKSASYLGRLQKNIDRASAITVISDFTGSQVREHLDVKDKPIYRIYNGISVKSFPEARRPGFLKSDKFFFTIGIISAKKNFHVLLPLMKQFPEYELVIAGEKDSDYAKRILQEISGDRIHLPGPVSEQDKYWLYSHCSAFLFPSLAEGFGMPVIEAMLLGKPLFTSTCASLPEIGGKFAFYWQNFDPDHMAEVVRNGLATCDRNKDGFTSAMKEYAHKFSWDRCIDDYLNMYEQVINL
jgi:glycosyltransferase involved in cell wall biosynthesis